MATKVSDATRQDLLQAIRERYRAGTKDDKVQILDEFIAVTGYHRKHVIRLFKGPVTSRASRRPRLPLYDEGVRQTVVVLWEASDRICGKRLKAALPLMIVAMERHGHLALDPDLRQRLLAISAATIDRLLKATRGEAVGQRRRRGAINTALQRSIPI